MNYDLPHTPIDAAPSSAPPATTRLPSARRRVNPNALDVGRLSSSLALGEMTSDDAALVQAQEASHGSK